MLKNIYAIVVFILILAVLGLAGTSDRESARRVPGYNIAGVYK